MTSFKTIKKMYKIEKKNKKLHETKKVVNMHMRIDNLQKKNKKLQYMSEDLIDIVDEQSVEIIEHAEKNERNMNVINYLHTKIKNSENDLKKLKQMNKCNSTTETKMMIAIVLCWSMVMYLFHNNIVEQESFMIMNLCGFLSSVIVSMF